MTRVIRIHPVGKRNVCTKFCSLSIQHLKPAVEWTAKCQPHRGARAKVDHQSHLGTMNACPKCCAHPSRRCEDISLLVTLMEESVDPHSRREWMNPPDTMNTFNKFNWNLFNSFCDIFRSGLKTGDQQTDQHTDTAMATSLVQLKKIFKVS